MLAEPRRHPDAIAIFIEEELDGRPGRIGNRDQAVQRTVAVDDLLFVCVGLADAIPNRIVGVADIAYRGHDPLQGVILVDGQGSVNSFALYEFAPRHVRP